jgi:Dolichyl-phosphate-mannose-protein mannosyltransferase
MTSRRLGSRQVHEAGSIRTEAGEPDRRAIDLYPRVGDDRFSDASLARATWAFVALGVTIRVVRLLLDHPLWGDECFVAANLIDRGYLGLLRPLDYQQVAPPLFLWTERFIANSLGFSEWTLRLFPTACAIASLFVFRHLAGRLMKGMPVLMGVAIVAVSLNPVRHGGEAKPYAVDFLASAILLALLVEWWRRPDRAAWLWALTASALPVMGLSFPSVFVLGGISLAILGRFREVREPRVIAAYLAFNTAIVAGAASSLALQGGADSSQVKAYMDHYWSGMFPPLDDPTSLVPWLIRAHTGQLFAYPVGGANGASLVTCGVAVVGLVGLCRRGRGAIALACVAPLGLALVASALRIYPYGESERLMQFEGPMACLLAGYGLAWSIGRFRRLGSYRKAALGCLLGFVAIGIGAIGFDIAHPFKTPMDQRAREFARWFWAEAGRDAELACARVDLGLDFEGGSPHDGRSADYLTYQAIYSTRRREGRSLDWSKVSMNHPLRCVLYDGVPVDSTLFELWMGRMARSYRLVRVESYRVNAGVAPRSVSSEDHLAVLEFVPIAAPVDPAELASEARAADERSARGALSLPGP